MTSGGCWAGGPGWPGEKASTDQSTACNWTIYLGCRGRGEERYRALLNAGYGTVI